MRDVRSSRCSSNPEQPTPGCGRPRCADKALDRAIAFAANVDKFTSPRQLKHKRTLDVFSDTVDRRLIQKEAGLYDRVARRLVTFTNERKV
jgi:hypothetical protein